MKPASTLNFVDREPKEFLYGLNWCAHLYLGGICKDYCFPTIMDLLGLLK